MTSAYVHAHVIPAALALLPAKMTSVNARAMLLAIGLQESKFLYRRQLPNGPAHGFWQFERGGGVRGVLEHPSTRLVIRPILGVLRYTPDAATCYTAIRHNDVLAAVFARLLLWTVPGMLAAREEPDRAWAQYLDGWRPGKPHPATWAGCFEKAWRIVTTE